MSGSERFARGAIEVRTIATVLVCVLLSAAALVAMPTARGNHEPGHPVADQGLTDEGEEQVFAEALSVLFEEPDVDTVLTMRPGSPPRDGCRLSGRVYWAYSVRGTICFVARPRGSGWSFDVERLAGENPFRRQSSTALATLEEEWEAATAFQDDPPNERNLIPGTEITYPFVYERIVAEFDSPRTGDFVIVPDNTADTNATGNKGAHGHPSVTQSRATLIVSGRGARRSPLSAEDEAALGIQHPDIAPTVASALGINAYFEDTDEMARVQNGTPSSTALLKRQDGEVLDELLEPKFNTFVVVVDGLRPEDVNATLMPRLTDLIGEEGDCVEPGDDCATSYGQARAMMVTETNSNHVAMMTGAYGEDSGIVANDTFDRGADEPVDTDRPELNFAETLFDRIETQKPWLTTAAIMGKNKLRSLFDCTREADDTCGTSSENPEGVPVRHLRPDFLGGALEPDPSFDPDYDCPAEPGTGSGYATNECVMDVTLRVLNERDPDFSFVNLPEVDAFSHLFGPDSPQAEVAVTDSDTQIGRLVDRLKASGRWQHSTIIVTADHNFGLTDDPLDRVILSQEFDGVEGWEVVSHGGSASVYLTDLENPNGPLTEVEQQTLKELRDRALAAEGVTEALYRLDNPADGGSAHTLDEVHPNWNLGGTPRIGELLVIGEETHLVVASPTDDSNVPVGNHGHPGDRHVPFVVAGGGTYIADDTIEPSDPDAVNEGDDTASLPEQAETVDVAPTIAWILGIDEPVHSRGRVLDEAFVKHPMEAHEDGDITEPIANRAAIFIFDGNNSVELHCLMNASTCGSDPPPEAADPTTVPNLREVASAGTFTRFGSIAAWPSVTFPNHNVVGSGAYPGHHGIVNNRFYVRETGETEAPIDPLNPEYPLFTFSSALLSKDVETLHEAVHRTYGDWAETDPTSGGAYTASVDEPSSRGADYATLEPDQSYPNPAEYIATENPAELAADTTQSCAESEEAYAQESVLDHIGQTQARRLFEDPVSHPLPKYLINNFTLTDGAGHKFGPHTECTIAAYRDSDKRFGRIIKAMKEAGVYGETLIVVTGDHGMENQDRTRNGLPGAFSALLTSHDIKHVMTDWQVYLKTMDVTPDTTDFREGREETVTFTVTDDDNTDAGEETEENPNGTGAPIEGATVSLSNVTGPNTSGTTDAEGKVTLTFTPTDSPLIVSATHPDYNERVAEFSLRCPGREDMLGNHIAGTTGDDVIFGTPGRDVICGRGGKDKLVGGAGRDRIFGGPDADAIKGGKGQDRMKGGGGLDAMFGGDGPDAIKGNLGGDEIRGGEEEDRVGGGAGDDLLRGGPQADRLFGRSGDDRLRGEDSPDKLWGGFGNDRLNGGAFRDTCRGGPGDDRLRRCE